ARTLRLEIAGTLECKVRFRRWRKISRAADQPGIPRGDGIEYLARGVAAGDPLGVCGKRREAAVPTIGELAPLHALHLLGELRVLPSIRSEQRRPRVANATTAATDAVAEMRSHPLGDKKLCIFRPAIAALREPNLFLPQWLAVRLAGVMFVRSAI